MKKLVMVFIASVFTSCTLFKSPTISFFPASEEGLGGTYFQEENNNINLIFSVGKFLVVEHTRKGHDIIHTDTITYGTWSSESDGMIAVSNDNSFRSSIVDIEVKELKDPLTKNKISIVIDNPIESSYKKSKFFERDVHYNIALFDVSGNFLEKALMFDHDTSYFQVDIPSNFKLTSFEILARPNENLKGIGFAGKRQIGVVEVQTARYDIKDRTKNSF